MRLIFAAIFLMSCSVSFEDEDSNIDQDKCDAGICEVTSNPPKYYGGGGYVCSPEVEFTINNQTFYQPAICPIPHTTKPEPDPDPLKENLFDETIENTQMY